MPLPRFGIRTRLRATSRRLRDAPYWLALRRIGKGCSSEYRNYLGIQLRRTLSKRDVDPGVGAQILIGRLANEQPSGGSVLCVGCRNGLELDRFRARGFESVVGIDLFSPRNDIRVMDMHELAFEDNSFDIVYSSHSLEHSYDPARVVSEIVRVARDGALVGVEVPVRGQASAADRVSFSALDELVAIFRPYLREQLLAEEQPPWSERNGQGTDIARVVFRIRKDAAAAQPAVTWRREPRPSFSYARVAAAGTPFVLAVLWVFKAIANHDYDLI